MKCRGCSGQKRLIKKISRFVSGFQKCHPFGRAPKKCQKSLFKNGRLRSFFDCYYSAKNKDIYCLHSFFIYPIFLCAQILFSKKKLLFKNWGMKTLRQPVCPLLYLLVFSLVLYFRHSVVLEQTFPFLPEMSWHFVKVLFSSKKVSRSFWILAGRCQICGRYE